MNSIPMIGNHLINYGLITHFNCVPPESLSPSFCSSFSLYVDGQFSSALKNINLGKEKLPKGHPRKYSYFILLRGACYLRLSLYEQVINDVSIFLLTQISDEVKAWGCMIRSRYFLKKELYEAAIHGAKEGIKCTNTPDLLCELYQTCSLAYFFEGKLKKALRMYFCAVAAKPLHPYLLELEKLFSRSIEMSQDPSTSDNKSL